MGLTRRAVVACTMACVGLLGGCGGGGGSSSTDSGSSGVGASASSGTNVLFAGDAASGSIAAFTTLSPAAGTITANVFTKLTGAGSSLAYDQPRDLLYVIESWPFNTPAVQVQVFTGASKIAPGAVAARTIALNDFQLALAMFLDKTNDTLWVGGTDTSGLARVEVFQHASTLSGAPVPDRILKTNQANALTVDVGRSILYVLSDSVVSVYEGAATISGSVFPNRFVYDFAGNNLSVDSARDILYGATSQGSLLIVPGASTASGRVGTKVTLPSTAQARSALVDSANDRLYVGALGGGFVFDNASALTASSSATGVEVLAPGSLISGFAFP